MLSFFYSLARRLDTPFLKLELSFAIRNFALGLISLFIPIYLLQKGFSVRQVVLYFIIYLGVLALGSLLAGFLSRVIKFKWLMVTHYPLFLITLWFLYSVGTDFNKLLIVAIAQGLTASLFWLGHHLKFRMFSTHAHRGVDTGLEYTLKEIASALAPVFGGLLIGLVSAQLLFIVSGLIYILAIIPLLFVPHIDVVFEPAYLFEFRENLGTHELRYWIIYGLVDVVLAFIWPLFIYLTIAQRYEILGLLAGISLVVVLIENIVAGAIYDKGNKKLLTYGAWATSLVFVAMYLAQTIIHVIGINIIKDVAANMLKVPLVAQTYNDSENTSHLMDYFIKQEIVINAAKIAGLCLMLIFPNINTLFLVLGIVVPVAMAYQQRKTYLTKAV
jgi:MFS family permease